MHSTMLLTPPPSPPRPILRTPKKFVCLLCNQTFRTPNFNRSSVAKAVYLKFEYLNHLEFHHDVEDNEQAKNIYEESLRHSRAKDNYNKIRRLRAFELRAVELMFTRMMRGFQNRIITYRTSSNIRNYVQL